jgi:RHS repeat-associated protein
VSETQSDATTGQVQQVVQYAIGPRQISQTTTVYSIGQPGTPSTLYFGYDGHGSVRVLLNSAAAIATVGGVRQLLNYDAYGNAIGFQLAQAATTLLYSGQQTDAATGLQYLRARYYNPNADSFTTLDPYAGDPRSPLSYNTYLYTQGDPINGYDPTGQDFDSDFSGPAIGALAAAFQGAQPGNEGETLGGTWTSEKDLFIPRLNGDFRVDRQLKFTPNANFKGNYKNIGFIQFIKRTYDTGGDGLFEPRFQGRESHGWAVDKVLGARYGWWTNLEHKNGSAIYKDPPGNSVPSVKWEFQVFAIERQDDNGKGAPNGNNGVVLSGIQWGFEVNKDGTAVKTLGLTPLKNFKTHFDNVIQAWNDQADNLRPHRASDQKAFGDLTIDPINLPAGQ